MKHTMRTLTLLMLAIVVGTGQTWAGEPVVELGYIVCNEANITGGTLTFYKDASCEHAIDFSGGKSGNLSSEDLASVTGGYTVYIKAVPNSTHTLGAADNTTHAVTFIKAEKTTNVFQARRKGSAPDPTLNLGHDITVTATDKRFVYSFTMPANGANATIHANFPAREVQQVEYVDANGDLQTDNNRASAYVIDGNETELGVTGETTWYVVPAGTISYTSGLRCVGNVNLIIADGATMAFGTADSPVSGDGLFSELDLNIFGQFAGTGVLHTNSSSNGIYVMNGTLTITNCTVDAVCSGNSSDGINGYKGITINGKSDGSNSVTIRSNKYGIYSPSGSVAITNCTVDVVCSGNSYGICANNGITINGISDGTNSVTVRSNGYGLYTSNGPVAITNCNVTVTGATLTGNTYDPCSDNGINGTQGITIKGCAAGNTVTVRSDNSCLSSMGGSLAITNCTVDVVCSGNSSDGISGTTGITINGISGGTNSVTVRSNKYGLTTQGSVAITNCNVEVTGATLTGNTYNPCSDNGINGTQGITIEGCATGNTVMVRSANSCLYSNNALAITNCMVDVASTGNHAIWGTSNVNFNGGQLTAMAPDNYNGIHTMGTITLGWANAETDFIKVSKYYGSTAVKIADGQHFRATKKENDTETTVAIISGTVNTDVIASLAGATLKPLEITGYVVTAVGTGLTAGTTIAYINDDTKFYVYGEGATVTVGNTGEGIVKVTGMDVSDSHTFTMPAEDVILTSDVLDNDLFTLANSSVDYNAGAQAPGIKYNNADFAKAYYTLTYMKEGQDTPTSEVQNSGNYAVTLTGLGAYIGEVNIAEKFVINPAPVTIAPVSVEDKEYDGTTTATLSGTPSFENGMIAEGDDVSINVSGASAMFADANVGSGKQVIVTGLALAGTDKANYILQDINITTTASITKKDLTVTAMDKTINYGDEPTDNGVAYDGFVNNEDENMLSGELDYDYTYTQGNNIGDYDITPKGLESDNYNINFISGTLTVEKKMLTLSGSAIYGIEKEYDGTTDVANLDEIDIRPQGIYNNDDVEVVVVSGSYASKNVGTNIEVTIYEVGLIGDDKDNYDIDDNPAVKATGIINQRHVKITGISVTPKEYDGGTWADVNCSSAVFDKLVDGDDIEPDILLASYDDANVGTNKHVSLDYEAYCTGLTGVDKDNYTLDRDECVGETTGDIAPAPVTVKADHTSKEWGTAEDPTLTATVTGMVNNEDANTLITYALDRAKGTFTDGKENSGEYTITPTGADTQGNYAVTYETGTFTIEGKPVTIKNVDNEDVSSVDNAFTITEDQNGVTLTLVSPESTSSSDPTAAPATVNIPKAVTVDHVAIDRSFAANKAATVYLPFTIVSANVTGGAFHKFTTVDDTKTPWEVVYTKLATNENIEANTPYIFLPDESLGGKITVNNGLDKVSVSTANPQTMTKGQWEFIGTYKPIKWLSNPSADGYTEERDAEIGSVYGFAAEDLSVGTTSYAVGQFVKVGSGAHINPMRAYLKRTPTHGVRGANGNATQPLPQTMKVVIRSANGETTTVGTLTLEYETGDWFSIDGHKLSGKPSKKGMYIHEGNKVLVP